MLRLISWGAPALHDSTGGTGEHYAQWKNSGGEREISFDLTYKWNLINKTNKRAKYNQRCWNKEQTDSNQRGGSREITWEREKGSPGTCIKDPWTKPWGRIKGGRWGWVGQRKVVAGKWRQLYLNNNFLKKTYELGNLWTTLLHYLNYQLNSAAIPFLCASFAPRRLSLKPLAITCCLFV